MTLFAAATLVLLAFCTAALVLVRACLPLTAHPRAAAGPGGGDPALKWRLAGILVGVAAAGVAIRTPELGRGVLLAAPALGLGVFAGALAGEVTRPGPASPVRRAHLRVRRTADYLPRALGACAALGTVLLFALATATTLGGTADDAGRPGRALACPTGTGRYGPWPGSYYTVPVLILVVAGLVLAGLTLRRVVRRPQAAELAGPDDAVRRRSAEVVTAAAGVLTLVPLCGIALSAGLVLGAAGPSCAAPWWEGAGLGLTGLGVAAFAGAAWCGAGLLPAGRVRA